MSTPEITTLGQLRDSGYRARTVKQELRENVIRAVRSSPQGLDLIPGILGYSDTVLPQVVAALLSRHDLLLLGLRGQAKTRILRALTGLLDEWTPVIDDPAVELPEDPLNPVTRAGRDVVARLRERTPVRWMHRSRRYHEKLATPDVTIADLVGEIDIVKHARGRELADEATMHFGLVPRANRGIFAVNELPDLPLRIQVGLFNVLQERDVQIRGYDVRLELDLFMAFSANPEDYTNRGRIVTPLKDRIGSVVRTHYPSDVREAMRITRENAFVDRGKGEWAMGNGGARSGSGLAAADAPWGVPAPVDGPRVIVPEVIHQIVEETIRQARVSGQVNQASGVSVRASIAALENVASAAELRGLRTGESVVGARVADLGMVLPACRGKIELMMGDEAADDSGRSVEDRLIEALMGEAVKRVLARHLPLAKLESVVGAFAGGVRLELDEWTPGAEAVASMRHIDGLLAAAKGLCGPLSMDAADEQMLACAGELVLEYLYVNKRLSKVRGGYGG
jgi:magnesium chelatase subunit I